MFRDSTIVGPNLQLLEIASRLFPESKLPEEIKPHLNEWINIRIRFVRGEISADELIDLAKNFGQAHDDLFNNDLFISAFRIITEKTSNSG